MLLPYTYAAFTTAADESADRAAHIGDDALVPPTVNHPDWPWYRTVSYTDTPEAGSASSEMSGVARLPPQLPCPYSPNPDCAEFAVSYTLQPPPEPLQPVSELKFPDESKCNVVPPTEMTFGEADGYSAGVPLSPDETKKPTFPLPVAKW